MLIRKHFASRTARSGTRAGGLGQWNRGGFTLIELLVVVSIIALLISILLPSLQGAREQAKTVVCSANMSGSGRGVHSYAAEMQDWIPGRNTTGVALSSVRLKAAADPSYLMDSQMPVQTTDWMTPLISYNTKMPYNRAERFDLLLNKYRCVSQKPLSSVLYPIGGGGVQDFNDFLKIQRWNPVSYLMPIYFQYWGQSEKGLVLSKMVGSTSSLLVVRAEAAPADWDVRTENFAPKISRVGTPAGKIFAADGTRFVDASLVDHDIAPWPSNFGSFTSAGAWRSAGREYGVRNGTRNWDGRPVQGATPLNEGRNLWYSYRHGRRTKGNGSCQGNRGTIDALFFDGHVENLSDKESRKIDYWFPSKSVVETEITGMTNLPRGYVVR